MKWFVLVLLALVVFLAGSPAVLADDPEAVVLVTARGFIAEAPGGFTLTYVSDTEIGIAWTKGAGAENTMIRARYGAYPEDRDNGYLVYYGSGESTADTSVSLDENPTQIYYRAWSQNTGGVWADYYAEDETGGFSVTLLALIMLAIGLTWMSTRITLLPMRLAASLSWLCLGVWLLIGDVANLGIEDEWTQLLGFVFILMTFLPLMLQFVTETRRTSRTGQVTVDWERKRKVTRRDSSLQRKRAYKAQLRSRWDRRD